MSRAIEESINKESYFGILYDSNGDELVKGPCFHSKTEVEDWVYEQSLANFARTFRITIVDGERHYRILPGRIKR